MPGVLLFLSPSSFEHRSKAGVLKLHFELQLRSWRSLRGSYVSSRASCEFCLSSSSLAPPADVVR